VRACAVTETELGPAELGMTALPLKQTLSVLKSMSAKRQERIFLSAISGAPLLSPNFHLAISRGSLAATSC
jgi:hypothetical protein